MSEWNDSPEQRPTMADFDPYDGCLDALNAWKNFGGLSRTEAYERFCELPGTYQEDFMFMGGVAFAYYYPVLERYILESRVAEHDDNDIEAMLILAYCIKTQFESKDTRSVQHLRQRILGLVTHVRNNLAQYCRDSDGQNSLGKAWHDLESSLPG